MNTVQKEHILLFDNSTVFADIIYDPFTGFRQQRLKLVGWKTAGWNGDYYAPGFVFDAAQVTYWLANTDYRIGDSVEYQGKFYVAKQITIQEQLLKLQTGHLKTRNQHHNLYQTSNTRYHSSMISTI